MIFYYFFKKISQNVNKLIFLNGHEKFKNQQERDNNTFIIFTHFFAHFLIRNFHSNHELTYPIDNTIETLSVLQIHANVLQQFESLLSRHFL
jgi:hypothetical protein